MTTHDAPSRDSSSRDAGDTHRAPGEQPSRWEWATAALGLALVLGALWVLLVRAHAMPDRPPDVALRTTGVHRTAMGWLVTVEAENRGDETAAGLMLEGTLSRAGQSLERAETQLDYLPARSRRTVGLYFSIDPSTAEMRLRPVGYQAP